MKILGFGAPTPASDIASGTSSHIATVTATASASIGEAIATVPINNDANTSSKADIEISDKSDDFETDISTPVVTRVYPPSKPHHGSGRQAEPLTRLRDELRNGVDRSISSELYYYMMSVVERVLNEV